MIMFKVHHRRFFSTTQIQILKLQTLYIYLITEELREREKEEVFRLKSIVFIQEIICIIISIIIIIDI